MQNLSCPCYNEATKTDCPRRHGGCAIDCKDWDEYVKRRNEEYRKRFAESGANSAIVESNINHMAKRQRYDIAERARRRRR